MLRFFKNEKLKCSATRSCLTLFLISLIVCNFIFLNLLLKSMKAENVQLDKDSKGFQLDERSNDSVRFNPTIKTSEQKQKIDELRNKVPVNINNQVDEKKDQKDEVAKEDENELSNSQQDDHRHRRHRRNRRN